MTMTAEAHRAAPPACAWCERPLDGRAKRLSGRLGCADCGAATTDPWPTPAELDAAYGDWYRPGGGRFSGPGDRLLCRSRGHLARRLNRIAPPGRVLDVGAGDGVLLEALRAVGREVMGLERRSHRADVSEQDLADVQGEWAAVVFWHSLEHLPRAGAALDKAAALLAPGGVLVVAVPNSDSLQARAFRDRWLALDLPRHLVHVPASVLLERIGRADLRVEHVSHLRGGQVVFGWAHGLVGWLPGHPDLYDAIRRPEARRVALSLARRAGTLAAAAALLPVAAAAAGVEAALHRGGSVYVEARRA